MPKVLVIRFSSIGDIVLTTPVVRCLKEQLGAEVHFCTKKGYYSLIEHNPYISKCLLLEDNLSSLIQLLKAENYDYVIDLHNNLRTRLVKLSLGKKAYSFNKLNWQKWLYVNFKINLLPKVHIVDRYMDTVKALNVHNDGRGLDYFIPEADLVKPEQLPETYRNGYIAYAIGGQHTTKKLPPDKIIELCELANAPILLLGGKEDAATGNYVESYFTSRNKKFSVYNVCGKYNLNQSASIIANARKVYTHDTGMMHIASALKKDIVSIWGNTTPAFGMYPYKTSFKVLENNNLNCRPCSKIGYKECPKKHFKCMREIDLSEAIK